MYSWDLLAKVPFVRKIIGHDIYVIEKGRQLSEVLSGEESRFHIAKNKTQKPIKMNFFHFYTSGTAVDAFQSHMMYSLTQHLKEEERAKPLEVALLGISRPNCAKSG